MTDEGASQDPDQASLESKDEPATLEGPQDARAIAEESQDPRAVPGEPEGAQATPDASQPEQPSADASQAAGEVPNGAGSDQRRGWPAEAWGQLARALALTFLLGMALMVTVRLSFGHEWLEEFLTKNKLGMPERMALLGQMFGAGGVLVAGALGYTLWRRDGGAAAATWERWSWFLSPLILLPAIPVVVCHEAWRNRHESLLPVVLFGALIAELFFTRAFSNVPPLAHKLVQAFIDWDRPNDEGQKSRASEFIRRHATLIIVISLALAYGAYMSFYTVRWHQKLGTAIFDLGINNNLLYGGLEGRFNESPIIFPEDPAKYVANHLKIGLYFFLPIYVFHPHAETLLVIQSVSMGLGAIPLFLFLRRRIPESWSALVALCYLLNYPMHGANFYEMKLVPTAAAIVLLCIYAIDAKRWWLGGITFVAAVLMREDMPVPMAVVGAVFLLSGHRPRAGLLMAGVATTWFVIVRFVWMEEVGSWWFPNMYEDLWAAPEKGFRSVIKTLVSNPTFTLEHIFVEKKFWYLMHLLVPLAFLPVRRWYGWAAMIPGAILTLLVTDYAPPTMFSFQYVMHWLPYLFVASGVVLASMAKAEDGAQRAKGAIAAMVLSSVALSFNYGAFSARDKALESGFHEITFDFSEKERKTYEDVKRVVASIPPEATVGATERVGAHLSSRVGFYTLRRGSHGVKYMVAHEKGLRLDRTKEVIRKGLESGEYGVVGEYGEFVVFRRGADPKRNEEIIERWKLRGAKKKAKSRSAKGLGSRAQERAQKAAEDATDSEAGEDEEPEEFQGGE